MASNITEPQSAAAARIIAGWTTECMKDIWRSKVTQHRWAGGAAQQGHLECQALHHMSHSRVPADLQHTSKAQGQEDVMHSSQVRPGRGPTLLRSLGQLSGVHLGSRDGLAKLLSQEGLAQLAGILDVGCEPADCVVQLLLPDVPAWQALPCQRLQLQETASQCRRASSRQDGAAGPASSGGNGHACHGRLCPRCTAAADHFPEYAGEQAGQAPCE